MVKAACPDPEAPKNAAPYMTQMGPMPMEIVGDSQQRGTAIVEEAAGRDLEKCRKSVLAKKLHRRICTIDTLP
jgi:hypothetical protein